MFIMCKQLNGPILKLHKPRSGPKSGGKNWLGRTQSKILYFPLGRASAEIQISLSSWAQAKIFILASGWAGPSLKKSSPCRPLDTT